MKSHVQIRNDFMEFFRSKGHTIVPSAPIVPQGDPTLLFTNAGMNQFKNFFLGTSQPEHTRIADTQKCLRVSGKHNDLEEVGRDTYHHTFFEMLGNWSIGDYFKKEAIQWGWEYLVDVCGLPPDRLYATVFGGNEAEGMAPDTEAESLWPEMSGIPPSKVLRFGKKDNFWEMGDTGPCGPCSEIHFDLGENFCIKRGVAGHVCAVNGDCRRFIELWNLVFIQFNRKKDGTLAKLAKNHVDTGMGFERLVSVIQKTYSNYETDLFTPLFEELAKITGFRYGHGEEVNVALRVVADHVKALSFAIADGAIPEKKGRGSVLRSILRRAARFGRQVLQMQEPFIYRLPRVVAEIYNPIFPETGKRLEHLEFIIKEEENLFAQTLDRGLGRFQTLAANLGETKILDGYEAYRLYHQDGFPRDLIDQMAGEQGMTIDEEGWKRAEEEHKERSKGEAKEAAFELEELEGLPPTRFVGYAELGEAGELGTRCDVKILGFPGRVALVLDKTPFYAESGGQVGDTGVIEAAGFRFVVSDTRKTGDYFLHYGELEQGDPESLPQSAHARVDEERRLNIMANHTVTHLLHWALKQVLGPHANQQGSEVNPDYFRFDVTHPQAITAEEQQKIEMLVNERIWQDIPVSKYTKSLEEAKKEGVTALFGEKYGQQVRVIDIAGFSKELCGGTHCRRTGEIGSFYTTSETSSEAGVRRIEGITRGAAIAKMQEDRRLLKSAAALLNTRPDEMASRIEGLLGQVKELKKARAVTDKKDLKQIRATLLQEALTAGDAKIVVAPVELEAAQMGELADELRSGQDSMCGMLASCTSDSIMLLGFASRSLTRTIHIGNVVKEISSLLGGGGGGRPDFAKGSGRHCEKLEEGLERAKTILQEKLQGTKQE